MVQIHGADDEIDAPRTDGCAHVRCPSGDGDQSLRERCPAVGTPPGVRCRTPYDNVSWIVYRRVVRWWQQRHRREDRPSLTVCAVYRAAHEALVCYATDARRTPPPRLRTVFLTADGGLAGAAGRGVVPVSWVPSTDRRRCASVRNFIDALTSRTLSATVRTTTRTPQSAPIFWTHHAAASADAAAHPEATAAATECHGARRCGNVTCPRYWRDRLMRAYRRCTPTTQDNAGHAMFWRFWCTDVMPALGLPPPLPPRLSDRLDPEAVGVVVRILNSVGVAGEQLVASVASSCTPPPPWTNPLRVRFLRSAHRRAPVRRHQWKHVDTHTVDGHLQRIANNHAITDTSAPS